jgi:hypothetical protein
LHLLLEYEFGLLFWNLESGLLLFWMIDSEDKNATRTM